MRARLAGSAVGLFLSAALAGCGATSDAAAEASGTGVSGTVTVLAASSLKEAFGTLGADFEKAHPGVRVTLSLGGSAALANQIVEGAPADVFAAASPATMTTVTDKGLVAGPTPFASNTLEIATPPGNPAGLTGVSGLADEGLKVAVCQPQVPCGAATTAMLAKAGVSLTPATLEPDVKSVLGKVTLGEVDAGLVYVTDIKAAGSAVTGVPVPTDVNVSTTYPIAALTKAPNPQGAKAFVAYVLSPAGQQVLAAYGFGRP